MVGCIKAHNNCRDWSKGSSMRCESLPKKNGNFCHFGAVFPPPGTDWCEILHGQADPRAPRLC